MDTSDPGRWKLEAPPRDTARRQGRLVLVSDDNEANQRLIARQLALLGVAADLASDGREALQRWRSGDYSLLLTDLHMPDMDGQQLTATIRSVERASGLARTPIVGLSAHSAEDDAGRCIAAGMDEYLSKPVPLGDLNAMLGRLLPPAPPAEAPAPAGPSALHGSVPVASREEPVDLAPLIDLVGGDTAVIDEVLRLFRHSTQACAAEMRALGPAGALPDIADVAHKLKSSARACGALPLADLCDRIEADARAGEAQALPGLLQRFDEQATAVEAFLARLPPSGSASGGRL